MKHLRGSTQVTIHPLAINTDCSPTGLGRCNSLGEYCGPYTASSVFLISIFHHSIKVNQSRLLLGHFYSCGLTKMSFVYKQLVLSINSEA